MVIRVQNPKTLDQNEFFDYINEIIEKAKEIGYEILYYPDEKRILIKGEINRFILFGYPNPFIRLSDEPPNKAIIEKAIIYYEDNKYSYIRIIKGDETKTYVIAEKGDVLVHYDKPYLILDCVKCIR